MRKWTPAFVALVWVLGACSAESGVHAPEAQSSSSESSTGGSPTPASPSSTPTDSPSESPTQEADGREIVHFDGPPPGPIALDGDTVAYPFADQAESWNTVRTSGLNGSGSAPTKAATSEWPEGLINWVALTKGWLAYVDQSQTQGDGAVNVLWRVWAVNLASGQRTLLATNKETADPFVPVVKAGGGYIFWSQAEEDHSARELVWKPGWSEPRVLLTHTYLTPGSESFSNGAITYLGPNGKELTGHTTGGDCWRVPVNGGEPEVLTHTALAMGCSASADTLIWTQHLPEDDPRNADIGELPFTTWTLDLTQANASPTKVYEGVQSGLYPAAGDGFTVWATATKFLMRSTTSGAQVKIPRAMSISASGTSLAMTTKSRGGWSIQLYDAP